MDGRDEATPQTISCVPDSAGGHQEHSHAEHRRDTKYYIVDCRAANAPPQKDLLHLQ